jgi:hypothetical protein
MKTHAFIAPQRAPIWRTGSMQPVFQKKVEINILKFQKIIKNLDTHNDDFYMCAKYQCGILSILEFMNHVNGI